jgi:hypothetical protein
MGVRHDWRRTQEPSMKFLKGRTTWRCAKCGLKAMSEDSGRPANDDHESCDDVLVRKVHES